MRCPRATPRAAAGETYKALKNRPQHRTQKARQARRLLRQQRGGHRSLCPPRSDWRTLQRRGKRRAPAALPSPTGGQNRRGRRWDFGTVGESAAAAAADAHPSLPLPAERNALFHRHAVALHCDCCWGHRCSDFGGSHHVFFLLFPSCRLRRAAPHHHPPQSLLRVIDLWQQQRSPRKKKKRGQRRRRLARGTCEEGGGQWARSG